MGRLNRTRVARQVWHVMSRGVRQAPVFLEDKQRLAFIEMMQWAVEATDLDVVSFCLMDNHYHLLADSEGETLSKFVQMLNSRYAREFNQQVGSNGHLFQGRFKSYEAKSAAWVASRALYIHLNPVEAGLVKDPFDYRWSSLRGYMGRACGLPQLKPEKVLQLYGSTLEEQRRNYLDHVRSAAQECRASERSYESLLGSNGADCNPEEVRLQFNEAKRLLARTREAIGANLARGSERAKLSQMFGAYLGRKWGVATAHVLAAALSCSVRNVYNLCKQAKKLLSQEPGMEVIEEKVAQLYATQI